jgi:hypothetical protein
MCVTTSLTIVAPSTRSATCQRDDADYGTTVVDDWCAPHVVVDPMARGVSSTAPSS